MNSPASPVWHPFTQHGLEEAIPLVDRAEGALLHCRDGRSLIDGISSWWVITHGHCEPRIVRAVQEQAAKLDQVIFAGYTHEPAEQVARALIRLTGRQLPSREPLTRVFFSDSGSTAVEVAIKMALGYWHNRALSGECPARHRILTLEHGYHGDTIGTMSVGERGVFNRAYAPLLFEVGTVPFPAPSVEQLCLDALDAACRKRDAAAFIVEPLVLGAGGMLLFPPEVLREMAAICARHEVLFIADEVMTGWGRTGTLFACEQASVTPDILCAAKGLTGGLVPLAATLAREKIFAAHWSQDRGRMFFHSSSFTANPIACAAAQANIALWDEEDILARVNAVGEAMATRLRALSGHPALENPRRLGAIAAIDLITPGSGYLATVAPALRAFFLERGLLLRPLGNSIYAMPPYCTTPAQVDALFDGIGNAADQFSDGRIR